MDAGPKVYKLKTPVTLAEVTFTELTFRKPRTKDWREMPMDGSPITMGHFLNVAARLANVQPAVIDLLEMEDMQGVLEVVGDFFTDSQSTGA